MIRIALRTEPADGFRQSITEPHPSTPPRAPTPACAAFQARFKEAAAYGKLVYEHPARSMPYKERAEQTHKPAFSLIMGEFMTNPLIRLVDTSAYHGQVGNTIDVRGREDLIASVIVVLRGEGEVELDTGEATMLGGAWRFTAGIAIPLGTAITVEVQVTDTSGLELKRRTPLVIA
jgi:hypothetical protein